MNRLREHPLFLLLGLLMLVGLAILVVFTGHELPRAVVWVLLGWLVLLGLTVLRIERTYPTRRD